MKEYPASYHVHFLFMGLFVFLLHGAKLNSDIIGIDTEDFIHLQDGFYGGWIHTGRQGLVLMKYLFGNRHFNPYFTGVMTLVLFTVSVVTFFLLWDKVSGGIAQANIGAWGLGGLLWVSHPIMAEQFYFSLQSMEICVCLILTALSLYLSYQWAEKRRKELAVGSIALLLLTFSSYQIFVVLYIFGTVAIVLLQSLQEALANLETSKTILKQIFPYCIIFLVAFLLNTLITKLFFSSSNYLQDQILWGQASIKDCFWAIGVHLVKGFTGLHSVFYHWGLGVLALFDLGLLVWFLHCHCRGYKKFWGRVLFYYMALLVTPFMMTVLLGCAPAARSQLVLPAMTGLLGYLGLWILKGQVNDQFKPFKELAKTWSKKFLWVFVAVCLVSGVEQAKVTESLYYTDRCRYEQDAALGRTIIERIQQIDDSLPVIVVGSREFQGNSSCVMGEVIGQSFFSYDTDVLPICFWSTRRVLGFLHSLGADFGQVPEEQIEKALEYSTYMPEWPFAGSVQEMDGMVIVKLSHYE